MAEAISIVLAIAPLIISAFEDYKHIARSFEAFKCYSQKIDLTSKALNVQAWIFRKEIERLAVCATIYMPALRSSTLLIMSTRLLSYCFDDEALAQRMLADRNDSNWEEPQIASLYLERLGDSRSAFEDSIELINHELSRIRNTLAEFKSSAGTGSKAIGKRIRYIFKESEIEKALATLKAKTQDLTTVVDLSIPQEFRSEVAMRNFAANTELGRFAIIQETAGDLYQALGHACTKHTYHQAHLCLEPVCCDTSQIRFAVAFSQLSLACSSNRSATSTWLTVESSITGRIKSMPGERSLTQTQRALKRAFSGDDRLVDSKRRTDIDQCSVEEIEVNTKVETRTRLQQQERLAKVTTACTTQTPLLVNLSTNSDFCDQLRKFINQSQPNGNAVGFLDSSGESKHLVYIDSKFQIVTQGLKTSWSSSLTTLQDAFAQSNMGFTMAQRISLARQLAKALLQFNTTPWLGNSWDSREVLIQAVANAEEENFDSRAFITAKMNGPHDPFARVELPPNSIVIRNRLIFSLGVILLELAFQKPLQELTTEQDRDRSHPEYTDYVTADRLSRQVSLHMGFTYAEVTRKCIHCDFGGGFDLRKSELRTGFYRDVVCELEKVEYRMKGR